ncbi:class I SAM-dependent methyltransferase [Telmatospirillum sp. J64-1]|uniref:class I SAM-dependent methyltransferase n=1 Tax=Telmatospirillum sp. J64-1 TaxID=2502183 RepID=UPI00115F5FBA|nr:class I SAM-dependent methyltransferase [Telmatospirillum sp. J64-1]
MEEAALDTLFLPLDRGEIDIPDRSLFLRARLHPFLAQLPGLVCQQSFRPWHDALAARNIAIEEAPQGGYPLVLFLPTKQRDETLAGFARAFDLCAPGGTVLCAMSNTLGASRFEAQMKSLAGEVGSLSKNKCRAFWARRTDALDQEVLAEWRDLDKPRPILDGQFVSRPGLFSWDRVDTGSALLARHLPEELKGKGAELGCGWGFLADAILKSCPKVKSLDLYEAEKLALDAAQTNLAGRETPLRFFWADATQGLEGGPYDFIVTNPPFHQGRADEAALGQGFIRASAKALKKGGWLLLVANRHLPYEEVLRAAFYRTETIAEEGGYKILRGVK